MIFNRSPSIFSSIHNTQSLLFTVSVVNSNHTVAMVTRSSVNKSLSQPLLMRFCARIRYPKVIEAQSHTRRSNATLTTNSVCWYVSQGENTSKATSQILSRALQGSNRSVRQSRLCTSTIRNQSSYGNLIQQQRLQTINSTTFWFFPSRPTRLRRILLGAPQDTNRSASNPHFVATASTRRPAFERPRPATQWYLGTSGHFINNCPFDVQ
jgi:hypothetical protein